MSKIYIARLSHKNFSLAFSEFNSILASEEIPYDIELKLDEYVVFTSPEIAIDILLKRSALILELGELIDVVNTDKNPGELFKSIIDSVGSDNACLSVDSVKGFGKNVARTVIKSLPFKKICTRKRIDEGFETIKLSLIANIAFIYRMFYRRRQYMYSYREPHRRPCYRPGAMKPLFARVFVNLSRASSLKGETILDPFCGVGSFAIEACLMGLKTICSDIDDAMIKGAKTNIESFGCTSKVDIIKMDAGFEAIASSSIDGIATDPPYGIQSSPKGGKSLEQLLSQFIDNAYEILKKGRFMVFAVPLTISKSIDRVLIERGFNVVEKHINMVHGSLTRTIYVVKKV